MIEQPLACRVLAVIVVVAEPASRAVRSVDGRELGRSKAGAERRGGGHANRVDVPAAGTATILLPDHPAARDRGAGLVARPGGQGSDRAGAQVAPVDVRIAPAAAIVLPDYFRAGYVAVGLATRCRADRRGRRRPQITHEHVICRPHVGGVPPAPRPDRSCAVDGDAVLITRDRISAKGRGHTARQVATIDLRIGHPFPVDPHDPGPRDVDGTLDRRRLVDGPRRRGTRPTAGVHAIDTLVRCSARPHDRVSGDRGGRLVARTRILRHASAGGEVLAVDVPVAVAVVLPDDPIVRGPVDGLRRDRRCRLAPSALQTAKVRPLERL